MNVAVAEYTNQTLPISTDNELITVDDHNIAIKVDVSQTTVVYSDVPVDVNVGSLTVTVAEGLQGPQGPAGAGVHQVYSLISVSSWSHSHPFLYAPEVRLIDASGLGVDIGVEYPDSSTVYIEFPTPFTGTVILS